MVVMQNSKMIVWTSIYLIKAIKVIYIQIEVPQSEYELAHSTLTLSLPFVYHIFPFFRSTTPEVINALPHSN